MILKQAIKPIFVVLSLIASSSALAAYEYTFTSGNFYEIRTSSQNYAEDYLDFNVTPESFLKVVINSETLLEATDNPLANATFNFSVEGFNNQARPTGLYGNTFVDSFLRINKVSQGLPTSWDFQYRENNVTNGDGIQYLSGGDSSGAGASFAYGIKGDFPFGIYAIGASGGSWSVAEISSPVPEPESYAMLMAGLGLIGFVSRKRNQST